MVGNRAGSAGPSATESPAVDRPRVEHPPGVVNGRLYSDANHPIVLRTAFDVADYTQKDRGRIAVDTDAVEVEGVVARDLAFLWRLEASALAEARAVLASWTANEARITAFITSWGFERYWMARALREVLEAAGAPLGSARGLSPVGRLYDVYVERVLPIVAPVVGGVVKEPVTAGHVARLAVQEGALHAAQRAMLPRLTGESRRVVAEVAERRETFLEFFRAEAAARILRSRAEATSARLHLRRPWAPLRVVGVPDAEETEALASIFARESDRQALAASDAAVGSLFTAHPRPTVSQVHRSLERSRGNHGV